jgi:hypothetical protein
MILARVLKFTPKVGPFNAANFGSLTKQTVDIIETVR